MLDTASLLVRLQALDRIDAAWGVLAVACLAVMVASPTWETIPFHVIWISLTLLYGFRVWSLPTSLVLGAVVIGDRRDASSPTPSTGSSSGASSSRCR